MVDPPEPDQGQRKISRREMIGVTGAALVAGGSIAALSGWSRNERGLRATVAILPAASYDERLAATIADGLEALGVTPSHITGRRILLKPNLVETAEGHACINTNPAMVVAAAEVFRKMGAADVFVAEGQGHRRDSLLVLDQSGMGAALAEHHLTFVDLNHDDVEAVRNRGSEMKLREFYLPKSLLHADMIVSMPKLKTHHWAGMTCAMKNLFGIMPGIVYGWPKNVLHYHGIPESIFDINATAPSSLAIVDGIVGMEGDGPIMGTPKELGCVVVGRNSAAVDATCARLIGMEPTRLRYLQYASGHLGPILERNIMQRGERIERFRQHFEVLNIPRLQALLQS